MKAAFTMLVDVVLPDAITCEGSTGRSPGFRIQFSANGAVPFPQVLIWEGSRAHLFPPDKLTEIGEGTSEIQRIVIARHILGR